MAIVLVPLAPAARLTLEGVAESVKLAGAATVRAMVVLLATVPDVPVTVTVETPGVAVAKALNVSVVLRVAVVAGLNVAVTPAGSPVAEKATLPLKVPCGVTAMVLTPLPPGRTLRLAGDAARVKPFAAPTVRLMAAVLCRVPDVPVMVMTDGPTTADADAVKVSVLVPAALGAPKEAVTPVGRPEAASETAPVKPFCAFTAMAAVLELPAARFRLAGVAAMLNAGVPVMVRAKRAVLVRVPDVPPAVLDDVPVIVIADVAATAELAAASVSVLVVVALAGLNVAVTPAGNPETARFTAPLKPCCALTVMVLVPLAPAATESAGADRAKLKDGALEVPVKALMSGWPAGLPQPVARS